jgi:hypothetical protein
MALGLEVDEEETQTLLLNKSARAEVKLFSMKSRLQLPAVV